MRFLMYSAVLYTGSPDHVDYFEASKSMFWKLPRYKQLHSPHDRALSQLKHATPY